MKFKKIVFTRCAPLTKHVYETLFIDKLMDEGVLVEYLDTTSIYFKEFKVDEYKDFDGVVKIKSNSNFAKYLKQQDNSVTLFIDLVGFDRRGIGIYYLLNKYNFKLALFARYSAIPVNLKTNLKQKLRGIGPKLLNRAGIFLATFLKNKNKIKSYDFVFTGGDKSIDFFLKGKLFDKDRKSAKIIKANANDYDRYMFLREKKEKASYNYIVFLDQYLPYHPDFAFQKRKGLTADLYYRSLNKKLDEVEAEYGLKVTIAAHPKAQRYKTENPFNGREIQFGKTMDLVSDSSLVLAHYSTAINFAILSKKPVILLLSNELDELFPTQTNVTYQLAKTLDLQLSFLEDRIKIRKISINEELYEKYKYDYMTSPENENKCTADILIDFLQD